MSHYDYLQQHLPAFFKAVGLRESQAWGMAGAHGDKCYSYRGDWEEAGIPFAQGVAIYMLSYVQPFAWEVRETKKGWVAPGKWVIDNWERFKPFLPPV
jgi:hypothetical protein